MSNTTDNREQLIEVILREIEPLNDMSRFREWLETLPIFQLQNWAEALTDI